VTALSPGQTLVVLVVFAGLGIVIMWGVWAAEVDRSRRTRDADDRRRLRAELERQERNGPPRWHR